MSWKITPGWSPADADAAAYITAVETADNQALENGVKVAIDNFVLGCKADGIWPAIKASCILAGARTLTGALVPLVGAAPTNFNFVAGDYNRETGLKGNGSTKYLDSNRNHTADPQDSVHLSIYATDIATTRHAIGANPTTIATGIYNAGVRARTSAFILPSWSTGFAGVNRSSSTSFSFRQASANITANELSSAPPSANYNVFAHGTGGTPTVYGDLRLAFYSIGESLDLALLDARVTTLINAFAAAIP
jgi:hypothetical protein